MSIRIGSLALIACAITAPAAVSAADRPIAAAQAEMRTADGLDAGIVELIAGPHGLIVSGKFQNLPTGKLGFHIHETGSCEPDFTAAGGHFNPDNREHGFANPAGYHAGDMPNIAVAADGTGTIDQFNTRIEAGSMSELFDEDGAALIVHSIADTYRGDADTGDRVACGVIEPAVRE